MAATQKGKEKRVSKYDTDSNKDNRMGVHWSPEEDASLMEQMARGLSISQIAELHQRTARAVEIHLSKLAAKDSMESGSSAQQMATKYRVTESMVSRELKNLKAKETKETKVAAAATSDDKVAQLEARVLELEKWVQLLAEKTGLINGSAPKPSASQ